MSSQKPLCTCVVGCYRVGHSGIRGGVERGHEEGLHKSKFKEPAACHAKAVPCACKKSALRIRDIADSTLFAAQPHPVTCLQTQPLRRKQQQSMEGEGGVYEASLAH
jgi:hypothetical protein